MMNQLFYSPETRIKVEEELKKLADETNPFRNGHISKWGEVREIPETIGEMMNRWNETLADSKLVKELFTYHKAKYFSKVKNLSNKKLHIKNQISHNSKVRLEDDALSTRSDIGYRNKGYRWFELGENFSLKDFITYHPETSNEHPYHDPIFKIYHSSVSIETLAEQAPLNEVNFLYACEGYAEAKYVAFLERELENLSKAIAENAGKVTMKTNLTKEQLRNLYRLLIEKTYIKKTTTEDHFIYFFSGEQLNATPKINWNLLTKSNRSGKSKSMAIYLLDKICSNLNLSVINNCIKTDKKGLDSNSRRGKYRDIDEILNQLK